MGPGISEIPKPDFVAHGGNSDANYRLSPGLGVWGLSPAAMWEDKSGTSHAAPLLSREFAFVLRILEAACERGARPFAVLAKAFLALTAEPSSTETQAIEEFFKVAAGMGVANSGRLRSPRKESAVLLWQGVLDDDKDILRVQIPIPLSWLNNAAAPHLRLVACWDPPVNSALSKLWSARKVSCQLRPQANEQALTAKRVRSHGSYPLFERLYDLSRAEEPQHDSWQLAISYEQTGAYVASMQFPTQQRVAFAAELVDLGETPLSPQAAIQALPIASTLNRLTIPPAVVRTPVVIKTAM